MHLAITIRDRFVFLLLMLFLASSVTASENNHYGFNDSVNDCHVLPAIGEVIGINVAVQLIDRFAFKYDYAQTTWQTPINNFRTGLVWDNDNFFLNQIAHPTMGGFYHIVSRANGLSYWQALPLNVLGSLSWELFGETDPISANDMLGTAIPGMATGEGLWRLGHRIFDKNDHTPIVGHAGLGCRFVLPKNSADLGSCNATISTGFTYGNESCETDNKPFDYFMAYIQFGVGGQQPIVQEVNVLGRVWGQSLTTENDNNLTWGVFQHLNYYELNDCKFSEATSFGIGVLYSGKRLKQQFHVCADFHGANTTDYYSVDERNYSFGNGYGLKSLTALYLTPFTLFTLYLQQNQLFTSFVQGDKGNSVLLLARPRLSQKLGQHFAIDLSARWFYRYTTYDAHPNQAASSFTAQLGVNYLF